MATKAEATRETRVTGTDSSPSGMKDQGLVSGQAHEFAIILPLKPGGGERMRGAVKELRDCWYAVAGQNGYVA